MGRNAIWSRSTLIIYGTTAPTQSAHIADSTVHERLKFLEKVLAAVHRTHQYRPGKKQTQKKAAGDFSLTTFFKNRLTIVNLKVSVTGYLERLTLILPFS